MSLRAHPSPSELLSRTWSSGPPGAHRTGGNRGGATAAGGAGARRRGRQGDGVGPLRHAVDSREIGCDPGIGNTGKATCPLCRRDCRPRRGTGGSPCSLERVAAYRTPDPTLWDVAGVGPHVGVGSALGAVQYEPQPPSRPSLLNCAGEPCEAGQQTVDRPPRSAVQRTVRRRALSDTRHARTNGVPKDVTG